MADYGTVAGVAAYVQHMTNSAGSFDVTTEPTLTQVEAFLDQTCDTLNGWLAQAGYTIPVTNARAADVLARWANLGAAGLCELSQRTAGISEAENRRHNTFLEMFQEAQGYIQSGALSALGAAVSSDSAPPPLAGLRVGGATAGGLALKPIFTRRFAGNDPTAENPGSEPDYP